MQLRRDTDAGVTDGKTYFVRTFQARRDPASPRVVNFSELEMKLRRICASFLSSVYRRGNPTGSSKIRSTADASTIGRNMPRNAEQIEHVEPRRRC
jgi:hypothetical protein